jgi:hypothetical protein
MGTGSLPEKQLRVYSTTFPPRDRKLTDALGKVQSYLEGSATRLPSNPNSLCISGQVEDLALGEPIEPSDISGAPGYVYHDDEVRLALTLPELYRFLRFNLEPEEFFALARKFGVFYAISGKWYNESTGQAQSPFMGPADYQTFMYKCMAGQLEPESIDDAVEAWHAGKCTQPTLRGALGMREDEYSEWATKPSSLYRILFRRMRDFGI